MLVVIRRQPPGFPRHARWQDLAMHYWQACDSITPYSTIKSKKKQGKSVLHKNFC
jgi:hypothetical protein